MKKVIDSFVDSNVPEGVKSLSKAVAIRWFGWGFAEGLMPVFLYSFVHSYSETGVLSALFNVAYILLLPLSGYFADKIPVKKVMIAGLLIYPFIGFTYFLAGMTGFVLLLGFARLLNGAGSAIDEVGRLTYIRKVAPPGKVASSFGYYGMVVNFWWIVAILMSMLSVDKVKVHYLFLLIIPTSLVALRIVKQLPKPEKAYASEKSSVYVWKLKDYFSIFKNFRNWHPKMKKLLILTFLSAFFWALASFILPVNLFGTKGDVRGVILMSALYGVPNLFDGFLGKLADKGGYHLISKIFVAITFSLLFLILSSGYDLQLFIVLLISVLLELVSLIIDAESTNLLDNEDIGTLTGSFTGIYTLGGIIAPVLLGLVLDLKGLVVVLGLLILAAVSISLWMESGSGVQAQ